jgi:SAM-dependent methyltransferase
MHDETLRQEFTHQAGSFATSEGANAAETLGSLVDLVEPDPGARWLDVACGPGVIARRMAPRVGAVHGVDLTAAMVETAAAQAREAGIGNATFSVGDATALGFPNDSFDGAVTRFSLHHVPRPARVVAEMARVVRPGGWVVVSDHLASEGQEAAAWHEEVERLRDPSHWACLTADRLRELGERAGLELESERVIPFSLDYEGWLRRGSGSAQAAGLIEGAVAERPGGTDAFRLGAGGEGRRLGLSYWLGRWRVPVA